MPVREGYCLQQSAQAGAVGVYPQDRFFPGSYRLQQPHHNAMLSRRGSIGVGDCSSEPPLQPQYDGGFAKDRRS